MTTATPEQRAFYEAVEIVYTATIALAERFAAQARKIAAEQPQHRERMLAVARRLRARAGRARRAPFTKRCSLPG